jgi:hypothetical protein
MHSGRESDVTKLILYDEITKKNVNFEFGK